MLSNVTTVKGPWLNDLLKWHYTRLWLHVYISHMSISVKSKKLNPSEMVELMRVVTEYICTADILYRVVTKLVDVIKRFWTTWKKIEILAVFPYFGNIGYRQLISLDLTIALNDFQKKICCSKCGFKMHHRYSEKFWGPLQVLRKRTSPEYRAIMTILSWKINLKLCKRF